MDNEKQIKIKEMPPLSEGIRLDKRTVVYPKKTNEPQTLDQLKERFCKPPIKLKEELKVHGDTLVPQAI